MIHHPSQFCQTVSKQDIDVIMEASLQVLETKGMVIQSQEACQALAKAGAHVDVEEQKVHFSKELVLQALNQVPEKWTLHARNPQKNIKIGGSSLAVVPGYGSAFIADGDGKRREALLTDFENLALMSYASDVIDITGGLLVEPNDVYTPFRPLEITYGLIHNSDKPFMGSVAGTEGAGDSIEMSRIVFGDISKKPCMVGLININSPLRLDRWMASAMLAYVQAGQPILLTPGIMMGISAPVTFAGAMVQAFAELMGCTTLIQLLRPGSPVIMGLGGFGSDLRNGTTGFGRPENALAIQVGAQIARQLKIPFRCSAAVTGARKPNCRSGYERMMTAMAAYHSGSHFCLQGAGILDSINIMSYEQYIIDLEIWSYIKRLSQKIITDSEALAMNVIDFRTENYMANEHTIQHMRHELFVPSLVPTETYEQWWKSDGKDVVDYAGQAAIRMLKNIEKPPIDGIIDKELKKYISSRKKILDHSHKPLPA